MLNFLKKIISTDGSSPEEMKRRLSKQLSEDFMKNIKTLRSQTDEDWTAESDENLKRISMHDKDVDLDFEEPKPKILPDNPSYILYKVKTDDTLDGISLKFNVSTRQIKDLNSFSSDTVYPGQSLKIKLKEQNSSQQEQEQEEVKSDGNETRSEDSELKKEDVNNSDNQTVPMLSASRKNSSIDLGEVYSKSIRSFFVNYCTSSGEVRGTMIISSMCIVFQPSPQFIKKNAEKKEREYFLSKFTIRIDLADVADCNIISVPSQEFVENMEAKSEYSKDFLLQLSLIGLGKKMSDKLLDEELSKLRERNIAFAVASFRIPTNNKEHEKIKNEEKSKCAAEIEKTIKSLIQENKQNNKDKSFFSKSKIPMVDIMYEKIPTDLRNKLRQHYKSSINRSLSTVEVQIQEDEEGETEEEKATEVSEDSSLLNFTEKSTDHEDKDFEFLPKMKDHSLVINYESFVKLAKKVPSLYRVYDWKLIYSMNVHGISLHNLYRRAEDLGPYFLIIKDSKDNVFGAFITDSIRESANFCGSGEMFLFTFKDHAVNPKCYHWTEKNHYFFLANEDGITIGSGDHYGLFIDKNLISGRTYKCETFDNDLLTEDIDFTIMKLELWTIEDVQF